MTDDPRAVDLAQDVAAARWYLRHPAVSVGSLCVVCGPDTTAAPPTPGGLLQALRADASRRRRKSPRSKYPYALEGRYRAQLLRRMRHVHRLLLAELKKTIAPLAEDINARAKERGRRDAADLHAISGGHLDDAQLLAECRLDSPATDRRALIRAIERVRRAVGIGTGISPDAITTLSEQVEAFVTRSVTSQVTTVFGIDVLPTLGQASHLLTKWAQDQAVLIKSLEDRYFDEIRDAVTRTITEGHSTRSLSRAIAERYGITRRRADLIATDQVGTLNGQITQERQTSLGIEEYIWDNVGDSRVRELHQDAPTGLGNTVRRWDDPHPTEGHPGMPIRCRCTALPNLTADNEPAVTAAATGEE